MRAFGHSPAVKSAFCTGIQRPLPRVRTGAALDVVWLGLPPWFAETGRLVGTYRLDLAVKLFNSVPPGLSAAQIHGGALVATSCTLEDKGPRRAPSAPQSASVLLKRAGDILLSGTRVNWALFKNELLRHFPGDVLGQGRLRARRLLCDHPDAELFLTLTGDGFMDPGSVIYSWVEEFGKHIVQARPPRHPVRRRGAFSRWRAFRSGIHFREMVDIQRYGSPASARQTIARTVR